MSPLLTWCLLGALLVMFISVMVLLLMEDEDAFFEAEDRDWLNDDLGNLEDDDARYPRRQR